MTILMHRQVLGCEPGDGVQVDHIQVGQTLDNRRSNLRRATLAENQQNIRTQGQFRGVYWAPWKGKWRATGTIGRKRSHLGYFDSAEEADRVASSWRREHMPFSQEALA